MKTYRYLFLVLTSFGVTSAFSQDILTTSIEWNCNSTFAAQPGTFTDEITKVTTSLTQITWSDSTGMARETMTILSSEGSWTNVSSNGSILFKVNSGDHSGIVQLMKSGGITKIRIQIVIEEESPIYELIVNDINSL